MLCSNLRTLWKWISYRRVTTPYYYLYWPQTYSLFFTKENKPNHRVYKFQLILMKFPNVHILRTEGKNLSFPDFSSHSTTTTAQEDHLLRVVEVPDSVKFFITHNQQTQPIQCQCAVSKECVNTITTETAVESPHFPIYLQLKDNYFKLQLENNLYYHISCHECETKAQNRIITKLNSWSKINQT